MSILGSFGESGHIGVKRQIFNEKPSQIKIVRKKHVRTQFYLRPGWQNLAAFRREQKRQWKFSSSAYFQFSRQMRRFCAQSQICKFNSVEYAIYTM